MQSTTCASNVPDAPDKPQAPSSVGEQTLRLLLVEDEPTQRMLVERQLRKAGYRVDVARDGDEALAKALTGEYQILITDWDLPGIDGPTLCRRLRDAKLEHYLWILVLTSHGSIDSIVAGLEAGADDYMRKPANGAELLARLKSGRRIIELERSLRDAQAQLKLLTITDPLLGTYNRRYLMEELVHETTRSQRYQHPLAAIMADLDRFKQINDQHGHQCGDEILRGFAELVRSQLRRSDWIARSGGEEFVIVLPETPLASAAIIAEKLRAACEAASFPTADGVLSFTVSFGVAALRSDGDATQATMSLLRRADDALYESKRAGRNRVTLAPK